MSQQSLPIHTHIQNSKCLLYVIQLFLAIVSSCSVLHLPSDTPSWKLISPFVNRYQVQIAFWTWGSSPCPHPSLRAGTLSGWNLLRSSIYWQSLSSYVLWSCSCYVWKTLFLWPSSEPLVLIIILPPSLHKPRAEGVGLMKTFNLWLKAPKSLTVHCDQLWVSVLIPT